MENLDIVHSTDMQESNDDSESSKSSSEQNDDLLMPKKYYVREMTKKFESLNTNEACYTNCNWWTKTPTAFTYFDENESSKSNDVNTINLDNAVSVER